MMATSYELLWSDPVVIERNSYELPLLIDENGNVVVEVSNWMRQLATTNKKPNTVAQYASTIMNFWNFISSIGVDWKDVFDEHLKVWRNLARRRGNAMKTVNTKLLTVYAFYIWAQKKGLIYEVIGQPSIKRESPFQIEITISKKRGKSISIGSDLLYRDLSRVKRPVPTQRDMDSAYVEVAKARDVEKVERDVLFLRWGSEAGLRRAEIQQLELRQISTIQEAEELQESGEVKSLRVVGKGQKARLVPVNPDLLLATAEYIRYARALTLAKLSNPQRSKHVFISTTTGATLSLRRISEIGSKALKVSNPELTFHRTRARYASRFCQVQFQAELDRKGHLNDLGLHGIMLLLMQNLGHSDPKAWEAYVQLELKMFIQANPEA